MEILSSCPDYEDPSRRMLSQQQSLSQQQQQQRQRRRQVPGSDHVKHRRTRSGCYTCRQRRVKCDETHPTCDRCRKGKRECVYPGTTSSTKPERGSSIRNRDSIADNESSASSEDFASDARRPSLATIPDDEDEYAYDDGDQMFAQDNCSAFSLAHDSCISPTIGQSPCDDGSFYPQVLRASSIASVDQAGGPVMDWSTLSKEVRMFLSYHRDHMSYLHYAFKSDRDDFLKTTFLQIAMNDDSGALLYAIVAFAAYHYTLARDDSKINPFLHYYNKSIMLLQQGLQAKKPGLATLLTILQLATIEEFLGDWVNLLGHQRAAFQILTDLFTPQTIMQDETCRQVINWYIRFDLFANMMSSGHTNLSRDWFAACHDFYRNQVRSQPNDLGARFEDFFATSRLLATDVTLVISARGRNSISDQAFAKRIAELKGRFAVVERAMETAFTDPSCFVKTFPYAPPPSENDITDFRDPNFLYAGDLFTMNYVLVDFWAIDLMFKYQICIALGQPPSSELTDIALKKCKMFEAIEFCAEGPAGAVLGCQASLGIASLFLPKDERHTSWCRRKYVLIEQNGYIYPATLRKRMSEVWAIDVRDWWLPDYEGCPRTVKAIRDFIQYRAIGPSPDEAAGPHVRDMSGIFRTMNIEDPLSGSVHPEFLDAGGVDSGFVASPERSWS